MIKRLNTVVAITIMALLTSCAASYKPVNPPMLRYQSIGDDSTFSYQYNVLAKARNRKLAKKEAKYGMRVVAVKIYNNTGQTLVYGTNFKIYSGNSEVRLLETDVATFRIRQVAPYHLFYLLLSPTKLTVSDFNSSKSYPIGLVIGPGLAIINVAVASTANKRFREELTAYDITQRPIANGETLYGLITVKDTDFAPLSLRVGR
ncbi:hypothetical protein FAM09_14760 [Niastella caeni]|uniref:Uncharacterized protein n=1 Tax=Niastella caeni TaxID=2569763 RepID=A0A4S8HWW5_9BACT|nr:hypothetical protein [Niastella caeni]THU39751.1 hypothetical protein FAM09_14760 [Niastella caeni]